MNGWWRGAFGLALAIFCGLVLTGSSYGETLRFVFLADSRASAATAAICPNEPLINTCALNAVNTQILALSPRPSFVVFGGDMSYRGNYNGSYTFQQFKDAMKPVTDAGIKLYVVLGNHELYVEGNPGYHLLNQQNYQQAFADMPANGPAGYESLVYSFESPGKDCFFAVLDPYYLTQDIPAPPTINGQIDDTQLNWLTGQVRQTTATHKFLFIHVPYYLITATNPDTLQDVSFTKLWQILDNNKFDIYFSGHTHLYSRKTIDRYIQPFPQLSSAIQWQNNVVQVINGTCGAEADQSAITPPGSVIPWHVHNDLNDYYFSVVDINGPQVKVKSYAGSTSGSYSIIDSFTVPPITGAGINLLLEK